MSYRRATSPQQALSQMLDDKAALTLAGAARPLSEALSALQGHPWRFAETMKDTPHWYTHIKHWNPDSFYDCVATIRVEGEIRYFRRWPYLELDLGEHTYWTMGYPVTDTTIINRRER